MPALFRGVCYADITTAKQSACSSVAQTWGVGHSVVTLECPAQNFNAAQMQICRRVDGGACEMVLQPYPDFPDCDYADGVNFAIEWLYLILPFIATLFFWRRIIYLFSGENDK